MGKCDPDNPTEEISDSGSSQEVKENSDPGYAVLNKGTEDEVGLKNRKNAECSH